MWTLLLSRLAQPGVFIDRRQFDSGEIRIGRTADMADWVLADPDRHLSRHHCTVSAVGLDLFVIDTSSNGMALNDASRRVTPQQPVPIRVRDRLLLGDYMIEVATEGAGAGVSLQPTPPPFPAGPGAAGLAQPDAWFDGSVDPIWGVGAPSAEVHEFLGNAMHDFLAPPAAAGFGATADPWAGPMADAFSKPILAPMTPMESAFSIPEDWAMPAAPARNDPSGSPPPGGVDPFGGPAGAADPFGLPFARSGDPFGTPVACENRSSGGPAAGGIDPSSAPLGNDPFAAFPPTGHDPFAMPATPFDPANGGFAGSPPPVTNISPDPFAIVPGADDPFAGFTHAPAGAPSAPAGSDTGDPFAPAPAGGDPFAGFAAPSGSGASGDPFAASPVGADPFDLSTPHRPVSPADMAAGGAAPSAGEAPSPTIDPFADFAPPVAGDPRAAFASAAVSPARAAPALPDAAGWAAFCEGAGVSPAEMRGSPEAMRRLGTLYRQVVLGLSDLIQDRAAFKNEFRVERTQLSFGKNNPLKHLPALESARLLLGDPLPGFMDAEDAVRGAFADVKKHQMAMLAGVQHALTAVFERLAPAEIERIMRKAAATRKGLPFGRGVNPWTVYQTVFDALRLDAASNVDSVMSVAFRAGYETFLKSTA